MVVVCGSVDVLDGCSAFVVYWFGLLDLPIVYIVWRFRWLWYWLFRYWCAVDCDLVLIGLLGLWFAGFDVFGLCWFGCLWLLGLCVVLILVGLIFVWFWLVVVYVLACLCFSLVCLAL